MNVLLVAWLHVLRVVVVKLLAHNRAWKDLLNRSCSSSHLSLISRIDLLFLGLASLRFLLILYLSPLHYLMHSSAQVIELEVSSCLRALVLLASVFICVDAFVILKVYIITIFIHWETSVISAFILVGIIVSSLVLRLSISSAVEGRARFTLLMLLVLRSHFVNLSWLFNWKFQNYSI